jgi:hypothetical protein
LAHLDLSDATFACPYLTKFCRLDELGLAVTGQRLRPDRGSMAVKDSKNPDGPALIFTAREWPAFIEGVKLGEFD